MRAALRDLGEGIPHDEATRGREIEQGWEGGRGVRALVVVMASELECSNGNGERRCGRGDHGRG